ncbi:basic leucine zipper transcriptional factor ATF-like [Sardina pilchardus]|uniref:basic leucine zipper transcriptional factor ATF-like n=1 Tax=Sardina pilchardus TaxID=27697 RepID=UPI002E14E486
MPGFFMDTKNHAESFASFSGEESQSSSDWGKDGLGPVRTKRKENNRDAARKSRKKQTERADVLHEEMQFLERSNAAFEKEIEDLRAELQRYTTALQQHEPQCSLQGQSRLAASVPPQAKAFSSTSANTSRPALSIDSVAVAVTGAPSSLPTHPGQPISEFSLSELFESTDWTPPWEPGHWSIL